MSDTPQGETVVTQAPSNEPGTASAPPVVNTSADVEAAKKEAEQARLRANQLENEKKALEAKLSEQERQKLEEKEEWKTLAEKTQAELKEFREAQDREASQLALSAATEQLLQEYPDNVREVAKTTGLALSEDSETAKTAFKEKLDTIKSQVGTVAPTGPNNPAQTTPEQVNREDLTKRDTNGVSPMALAGARGDDTVIKQYISAHPAVVLMRKQAGMSE